MTASREPLPVLETILRRIAEGDQAAVRECISRHGGLVWSLARRLSDDRLDAEDAVQEIFLALWTHAARYDASVASETTFVAMIARRTLIDRRRKRTRRLTVETLPDQIPAADEPEPLDWLERRDEGQRARQALQTLGEDQRQVLTLSIDQGLTYDQIAQATGLPLGTVKTHARRALIHLRRELDASSPRPTLTRNGGDS